MEQNISRSFIILRNIGYNFVTQFWLLVLSLVTVPYIVNQLGADAFGIWAILGVVMGYFSFLDLGLGQAIIKYLAEYYGRRDFVTLTKIIGTSQVVYLLLGGFGSLLLALLTGFIVNTVLKIPQGLITTAQLAFYLSALGFLINMPLAIFGNIPNALQRMDITGKRNIAIGTVNILLTVFLLWQGFGLIAIVILNVILSAISIGVFVIASKRLLPEVKFKPAFDSAIFKMLFTFGVFKFFNQLSGQVVFQLDKLLIGIFLPISFVTFYVVPLTLTQKIMALIFNVAGAFFPAASELSGLGEKEKFQALYLRVNKLVFILIAPLFLMLYVLAGEILTFWLGGEFPQKSLITLQVLAAGYFIQSLSTIPALTAESVGKPYLSALFSLISAAINLTLALILIPRLGIAGAAWAVLGNGLAQVPIFIYVVNRKIVEIKSRQFLQKIVLRPVLALIFLLPFLLFFKNFIQNLPLLLLFIILGELIFFAFAFILGVIDKDDREILKDFIGKFKSRGLQEYGA